MTTTPSGQPIVVGVDGSEHSLIALAWAIDEARTHGAPLHVIHSFVVPRTIVDTPDHGLLPELSATAQKELDALLERGPSTEGVDVHAETVAGHPAKVLVEASRTAALLVVGRRGHEGFDGLLLGSVATQCVHHAHCPVVVVH